MSDLASTLGGLAIEDAPQAPSVHVLLCRFCDIIIATAVLIFIAPLLLIAMIIIWSQDGGPIIFAHRRVGRYGRPFDCLKLRSMRVDAAAQLAHILATDPQARAEWDRDQKLRDDPRITKFGRFLRRSSIDEFPQLWNVLKGEMSLVGPRPIVPAEVARYGRRFRDYCSVKPGITGLWQVSGRNNTSYRRRVAIDTCYARRQSLALDMRILVATVPSVLLRKGSY